MKVQRTKIKTDNCKGKYLLGSEKRERVRYYKNQAKIPTAIAIQEQKTQFYLYYV